MDYWKKFLPSFVLITTTASGNVAFGQKLDMNSVFANEATHYSNPDTTYHTLDGETLGKCMVLAAKNLNIPLSNDLNGTKCIDFPSMGSSTLRSLTPSMIAGEAGIQGGSDFLQYLGSIPQRKCDYVTGQEDSLKKWVLGQKDKSINPISIFQESLVLNHGNIIHAVLSIHQLLRNEARWWDSMRYNVPDRVMQDLEYPARAKKELNFFDKFQDLRGDLQERGGLGDHPGTWYRIWGAMLYRLSEERPVRFPDQSGVSCLAKVSNSLDLLTMSMRDYRAKKIFEGDENMKKNGCYETDPRKVDYDIAGGNSASEMFRGLIDPSVTANTSWRSCQDGSYLKNVDHPPEVKACSKNH